MMDFIIVLHDSRAVKTFCSRIHFSIGAGCSAAAGPVGRVLEADLRAGDRGSGMCYTYSCSKGIVSWIAIFYHTVELLSDESFGLSFVSLIIGCLDLGALNRRLYSRLDRGNCKSAKHFYASFILRLSHKWNGLFA